MTTAHERPSEMPVLGLKKLAVVAFRLELSVLSVAACGWLATTLSLVAIVCEPMRRQHTPYLKMCPEL